MDERANIDVILSGERYISIDVFVGKYLGGANLFQGYVIGLGYIRTVQRVMPPPHLNGQSPETRIVPYEASHFMIASEMKSDCSPEAVKQSLKGLFVDGKATVTVKDGMTLSAIASLFDVTVDDLVRWNKIEDPNKIVVGQKIVIHSDGKRGESLVKNAIGYAGYLNLIPTIASGIKYTGNIWGTNAGGFWRGANGRYYGLNEASAASGRGWNFRANSASLAKDASKWLRNTGNIVGVATTAYSGYCFIRNPNWEDGLDTGFGIAGLVYWPIGVVYSYEKLNLALMPSMIEYNIERAGRIAKGDWSMAFWTFGRSVK